MAAANAQTPIYTPRIVAFVDILGFKNMVLNSQSNYSERERIMQAMNIIHGQIYNLSATVK